jgi:hypothetical protein
MRTKQLICFTSFVLVPALVGSTRGDPVPHPWISQDIGAPIPGSADWNPAIGVLTITGNGHDIWDNADDFRYVYMEWGGDFELIARVASFPLGIDSWQKAGLMVRQNITPGSPFVDMVMTGIYGGGANFQWRDNPNVGCGNDVPAPDLTEPQYIRLTRIDNTFAGYYSADGINWTQLGGNHFTIMTDPVLIGLCITSHEPGFLVTAIFDNIEFPPLPCPCPRRYPFDGSLDVPVDANLSWLRGPRAVQ